jgi:hypothetical protein
MKQIVPRWGLVLTAMYFCVVVASIVFMFVTAQRTAFCGLYAIVVTQPWSILLTGLVDSIAPTAFDSMIPGVTIIIISGILNCLLILAFSILLQKRIRTVAKN